MRSGTHLYKEEQIIGRGGDTGLVPAEKSKEEGI